jgi:hypothetical protein
MRASVVGSLLLMYPTYQELVADSTVEALTSLDAAAQESLFLASKAAVEEFCGQTFDYQPATTYTLDGAGGTTVYLPRRLEALTDLVVDGSSLSAEDVIIGLPDQDKLSVRSDIGAIGNYYTKTLRQILSDTEPTLFTYGVESVTITGDWGWATFPPPVGIAIRKDMEDQALADSSALNESIRAYRKLGLRDISQGNLRAAVGGAPGLSDEVVRLLMPYVWIGNLGAVV